MPFANLCSWESVVMAVEFLFVGGDSPESMLRKSGKGLGWRVGVARRMYSPNNRLFTEISHDCEYAKNGLLNPAPEPDERSGRYRLKTALPT